jgi:thioredoxin-related protein
MAALRTTLKSILLVLFFAAPASAETRLLMFEEIGCPYCAQWHREVGKVYHKTAEGLRAPVVVLDLGDPLPKGVTIGVEPYFTPTFVLVRDGKEVGRIEGYPGESFFYGLLEHMLDTLDKKSAASG